jgi:outer membrane murein-binding lipoprotein Lpp
MYMKAIIMGMAAMGLLLFAGCATSTQEDNVSSAAGDGPAALVNQWVAALQAEDVNAVMTHFSDRYNNPEYGDKQGARASVEQARVLGYLRGLQADTSAMEVSRDGAGVIAGPVRLRGAFGQYNVNLRLAEEAGAWKIVGTEELNAASTLAQVNN